MLRPYIFDLHQDVPYYIHLKETWTPFNMADDNRPGDLPEYMKANVKLIFTAVFPLANLYTPRRGEEISRLYKMRKTRLVVPTVSAPFTRAIELINTLYLIHEKYQDQVKLIMSREDLEGLLTDDRLGFLISLEGTEALYDTTYLEIFYRLGIRAIGLTWNYDTRYAASCMSKKDYGLTGVGEELVMDMNRYGIIIDLAHSSKGTMLEAIEISKKPVIISHSNYTRVVKHPRNVDDDILEALSANRGVVGFTLIKSTLGRGGTIEALARHITAVYENYGPDILAIGTDYFGIKTPRDAKRISALNRLWPILLDNGLRETDIEKLAWRNAYRVIKENSKAWKGK